jgi:hypothetical protein
MMKYIGQLLFPRLPTWEARRRTKVAVGVVLSTLIFAAGLVAMLLWMNSRHR